jgi:hypothetical protein
LPSIDAGLRFVCRGRSRPTKSPGLRPDGARQTDPREHQIDSDARGEVRDERSWADAASSGNAVKSPSDWFDFLSVIPARALDSEA